MLSVVMVGIGSATIGVDCHRGPCARPRPVPE
jgi:hypothetical protein